MTIVKYTALALWLAMIACKLCGYGYIPWWVLLWPIWVTAAVLAVAFFVVAVSVGIKAIFMGR